MYEITVNLTNSHWLSQIHRESKHAWYSR